MKTAFLCFFPVIPTNMGSAEVIRSFFLCWPGKKKLFQITHLKDEDRAFTRSFRIFKEKPILKLLVIPFLLIAVLIGGMIMAVNNSNAVDSKHVVNVHHQFN